MAGCGRGETLLLSCLPVAVCSGRMIAALCKLPHPRSRGQASTVAQIQSSSGEPCTATLLRALRWRPNTQLGAAQAPAWHRLCPGGTKVPQRAPIENESHGACCPPAAHGSRAAPLSQSPSVAKPAAGGSFPLPSRCCRVCSSWQHPGSTPGQGRVPARGAAGWAPWPPFHCCLKRAGIF